MPTKHPGRHAGKGARGRRGAAAPRVEITVLKTMKPSEVFAMPPVRATYHDPCPFFRAGQTLFVDARKPEMPEGFCLYAWNAIYPAAWEVVAEGLDREWYEEPGKGLVVVACPDGLRPVIFRLAWK